MQRIRVPHGLSDTTGFCDSDERSFANAGAPLRGFQPLALVVNQFRPERKGLALERFGGVNGTAIVFKKNALDLTRNSQPAKILRAIDIAALENRRAEVQEAGQPDNVSLSEINKSLLFATLCTAGLALESHDSLTDELW
jgi:hypothetical protein